MRVSACLDRVSVLDLDLTVHFLKVLDMHPEIRPPFFLNFSPHTHFSLSITVSYKKQFNCYLLYCCTVPGALDEM